jgi:hypothetical protein
MQNQSNPFALVAVVALALACFGIYTATNKKSCECPVPQLHDDRDWPVRRPSGPVRPRRPDGSTGTEKDAPTDIVKRDM